MPTRAERIQDREAVATVRAQLAALRLKMPALRTRLAATPKDTQLVSQVNQLAQDIAAEESKLRALRGHIVDDGAHGSGADLLDQRLPVALLPLRLETRYFDDNTRNVHRLLIRIYPDDIHVDGHEQPLTAKESAAWGSYWNRLRAPTTSDRHTALDLWRQLVAEVGLRRALYLATLDDAKRVGRRPLAWCTSPKASCLPDRFIAHIWLSEPDSLEYRRPDLIIPALNLVTEPLFLGPDPWRDTADTSLLGSAAAWMHDFKAALVAGMGIDVNLGSPDAIVHRLVVVGVRASVAGQAQADEFAALLRAHELTNGLDICPPGSATNALPGERPLYTSTPSLEQLFDDQLVGSLAPPRRPMRKYQHMEPTSPSPGIDRRTASYRLSFALGLPPQALGYVEHGAAVRDDKRGPAVDLRRVIRMLVEPAMRTALGDQVSNDALGSVLSRYEAANQLEPSRI